jgi:hypothetical protein
MYLEIGFILFLIISYIYVLNQEIIHGAALTTWTTVTRGAAAVATIATTVTGAYYIYKNPDVLMLIRERLLKKQPSIGDK